MSATATAAPEAAPDAAPPTTTDTPPEPRRETDTDTIPDGDFQPADTNTETSPDRRDRAARSRRPRGVPVLVHGANGASATVGGAYAAAGGAGVAAVAAAGAAVGAAALYRKRKDAAAARRSAAAAGRSGGRSGGPGFRNAGGSGRNGGPGSRSGLRSGGLGSRNGGPGARNTNRLGRNDGTSPRSGSRNSGPSTGTRPGTGAGRDRTARTGPDGLAGRERDRNRNGKTRPGNRAGTGRDAAGAANRHARDAGDWMRRRSGSLGGRAWQGIKAAAGRARRWAAGGMSDEAARKAAADPKTAGRAARVWRRLRKWRRRFARRGWHYARTAGLGLAAGIAFLVTLPAGVAWGMWRTLRWHRDPLHAWLLPVRLAGRIWRAGRRRSKQRADQAEQADQLNLTITVPGKDIVLMGDLSPATAGGTTTGRFTGHDSKFRQAMDACYAGYASYRPRSMMEVIAEYAGLPNAVRSAASSVQHLAVNADARYPSARTRAAIGKLLECYERLLAAGKRAEDTVVVVRTLHKVDIERITNPRTNEWMWNVTPLGSGAPEGAMYAPGRIETGCVLSSVLYRTYEPDHMMQVGEEYAGIGAGLVTLGEAITLLYQRSQAEYPVDDRVVGELAAVAEMVRAAGEDATLAARLFEAEHAEEIRHNDFPRKGPAAESMWNA